MEIFKRVLPVVFFALSLGAVIYFIPPPKSWTQASVGQILVLLLPLLAITTSFSNLILNHLPRSFVIGLATIMLLALWMIDRLGVVTATLTIIATILLILSLPQKGLTRSKRGLTRRLKVPKLSRFRRKSP